jgi:uncharacterized protein YvpB
MAGARASWRFAIRRLITPLRPIVLLIAIVVSLFALSPVPQRPAREALAASTATTGQREVFVRGTDNALWHRSFNGGNWGTWKSLGGYLTTDPAAVRSADGHIDVFGRGSDNSIWHRAWDGTAWGTWASLGGLVLSAPALASWGAGHLDLFAAGVDTALYHKSWDGTTWSSWEWLGGSLTSSPAATSWGPGRIDVFARGRDNAAWHRAFSGTWGPWNSVGGALISSPAVASQGPGSLNLVAAGTNKAIWHRAYSGSWGSWGSLGGAASSDPSAASAGPGQLDVSVRGTDGALWMLSYANGWETWKLVGGVLAAGIDPVTLAVPVIRQSMNLDCETAALQMALAYRGHNYSQQQLFALENPDTRPPIVGGGVIQRWGDPYTNFVGNVNGTDRYPPTGYGIYYPPLVSIAHSHGSPGAVGGEAMNAPMIYEAVASGQPVMAWVEVGWYRPAIHYWTAWDGRSIRYTLDEHTVVLSGVTLSAVRINDPWHGTQSWVSRTTLETSWADFNGMAIIFK